jgi:O-antigen ligase
MSAWPSQPGMISRRRPSAAMAGLALSARRLNPRVALWLGCLICVLIAQGIAITHSYLWAAPLVCVLVVAVATDLPIILFTGVILTARVLTDASVSTQGAGSGSVGLSGGIGVLLILVAVGVLLRRRRGLWPAAMAALWLCLWTAIAVVFHGASTETMRQTVREGSVVALAVIVFNSRGALTVSVAARLVQLAGIASALLAIYQFGTHTGLDIAGQIRANGTFNHPDGAVMFFAIATVASLWRYVDAGRHRSDALFTAVYAAAAAATFSLDGLVSLLVMLMAFGVLRPGSPRIRLGAYAVVGLLVIAFMATPLGAERIAEETSTKVDSASTHVLASTSLGWRFYKWGLLITEWEENPFFGKGLGTTTSAEGNEVVTTAGHAPHNEYLRYLVETGVVGLAILLWAAVVLIRRLNRLRKMPGILNAGTLGIAIAIGCLLDAVADNTFLYTTTAYAATLIVVAVLSSSSSTLRRSSLTRAG